MFSLEPNTNVSPRLRTCLTVVSALAIITAFFGIWEPVRIAANLAFLLLVPGTALLSLLPKLDVPSGWALAIGSSLAINSLLSSIALWLHLWSPNVMLAIVSFIAIAILYLRETSLFRSHSTLS